MFEDILTVPLGHLFLVITLLCKRHRLYAVEFAVGWTYGWFFFQGVCRHDPVQDLLYWGGVCGRSHLYHHSRQVSGRHGNGHRPQSGQNQPVEL